MKESCVPKLSSDDAGEPLVVVGDAEALLQSMGPATAADLVNRTESARVFGSRSATTPSEEAISAMSHINVLTATSSIYNSNNSNNNNNNNNNTSTPLRLARARSGSLTAVPITMDGRPPLRNHSSDILGDAPSCQQTRRGSGNISPQQQQQHMCDAVCAVSTDSYRALLQMARRQLPARVTPEAKMQYLQEKEALLEARAKALARTHVWGEELGALITSPTTPQGSPASTGGPVFFAGPMPLPHHLQRCCAECRRLLQHAAGPARLSPPPSQQQQRPRPFSPHQRGPLAALHLVPLPITLPWSTDTATAAAAAAPATSANASTTTAPATVPPEEPQAASPSPLPPSRAVTRVVRMTADEEQGIELAFDLTFRPHEASSAATPTPMMPSAEEAEAESPTPDEFYQAISQVPFVLTYLHGGNELSEESSRLAYAAPVQHRTSTAEADIAPRADDTTTTPSALTGSTTSRRFASPLSTDRLPPQQQQQSHGSPQAPSPGRKPDDDGGSQSAFDLFSGEMGGGATSASGQLGTDSGTNGGGGVVAQTPSMLLSHDGTTLSSNRQNSNNTYNNNANNNSAGGGGGANGLRGERGRRPRGAVVRQMNRRWRVVFPYVSFASPPSPQSVHVLFVSQAPTKYGEILGVEVPIVIMEPPRIRLRLQRTPAPLPPGVTTTTTTTAAAAAAADAAVGGGARQGRMLNFLLPVSAGAAAAAETEDVKDFSFTSQGQPALALCGEDSSMELLPEARMDPLAVTELAAAVGSLTSARLGKSVPAATGGAGAGDDCDLPQQSSDSPFFCDGGRSGWSPSFAPAAGASSASVAAAANVIVAAQSEEPKLCRSIIDIEADDIVFNVEFSVRAQVCGRRLLTTYAKEYFPSELLRYVYVPPLEEEEGEGEAPAGDAAPERAEDDSPSSAISTRWVIPLVVPLVVSLPGAHASDNLKSPSMASLGPRHSSFAAGGGLAGASLIETSSVTAPAAAAAGGGAAVPSRVLSGRGGATSSLFVRAESSCARSPYSGPADAPPTTTSANSSLATPPTTQRAAQLLNNSTNNNNNNNNNTIETNTTVYTASNSPNCRLALQVDVRLASLPRQVFRETFPLTIVTPEGSGEDLAAAAATANTCAHAGGGGSRRDSVLSTPATGVSSAPAGGQPPPLCLGAARSCAQQHSHGLACAGDIAAGSVSVDTPLAAGDLCATPADDKGTSTSQRSGSHGAMLTPAHTTIHTGQTGDDVRGGAGASVDEKQQLRGGRRAVGETRATPGSVGPLGPAGNRGSILGTPMSIHVRRSANNSRSPSPSASPSLSAASTRRKVALAHVSVSTFSICRSGAILTFYRLNNPDDTELGFSALNAMNQCAPVVLRGLEKYILLLRERRARAEAPPPPLERRLRSRHRHRGATEGVTPESDAIAGASATELPAGEARPQHHSSRRHTHHRRDRRSKTRDGGAGPHTPGESLISLRGLSSVFERLPDFSGMRSGSGAAAEWLGEKFGWRLERSIDANYVLLRRRGTCQCFAFRIKGTRTPQSGGGDAAGAAAGAAATTSPSGKRVSKLNLVAMACFEPDVTPLRTFHSALGSVSGSAGDGKVVTIQKPVKQQYLLSERAVLTLTLAGDLLVTTASTIERSGGSGGGAAVPPSAAAAGSGDNGSGDTPDGAGASTSQPTLNTSADQQPQPSLSTSQSASLVPGRTQRLPLPAPCNRFTAWMMENDDGLTLLLVATATCSSAGRSTGSAPSSPLGPESTGPYRTVLVYCLEEERVVYEVTLGIPRGLTLSPPPSGARRGAAGETELSGVFSATSGSPPPPPLSSRSSSESGSSDAEPAVPVPLPPALFGIVSSSICGFTVVSAHEDSAMAIAWTPHQADVLACAQGWVHFSIFFAPPALTAMLDSGPAGRSSAGGTSSLHTTPERGNGHPLSTASAAAAAASAVGGPGAAPTIAASSAGGLPSDDGGSSVTILCVCPGDRAPHALLGAATSAAAAADDAEGSGSAVRSGRSTKGRSTSGAATTGRYAEDLLAFFLLSNGSIFALVAPSRDRAAAGAAERPIADASFPSLTGPQTQVEQWIGSDLYVHVDDAASSSVASPTYSRYSATTHTFPSSSNVNMLAEQQRRAGGAGESATSTMTASATGPLAAPPAGGSGGGGPPIPGLRVVRIGTVFNAVFHTSSAVENCAMRYCPVDQDFLDVRGMLYLYGIHATSKELVKDAVVID